MFFPEFQPLQKEIKHKVMIITMTIIIIISIMHYYKFAALIRSEGNDVLLKDTPSLAYNTKSI